MSDTPENIAATLARTLPKAELLGEAGDVMHYAVPSGFAIEQVDIEPTLDNPRRKRLKPAFSDAASFLAYIARHASEHTVCWCSFDPQTYALSFGAVLDDHAADKAGWRQHQASFTPAFSHEWKSWIGKNKESFKQLPFAEWIQEHEEDIAAANGLPTSLQMLEMATNFVANEERALKSAVRLQSGGVRLTYVADPDKGTTEEMKLFERFALGIPVFHGGEPWSITARLKYRSNASAVSFHFELVRPDRVHEHAAQEMIEAVRVGLGTVPLLMGKSA
jgi:uncharacterized protein YfdQ (DUF2303 family)